MCWQNAGVGRQEEHSFKLAPPSQHRVTTTSSTHTSRQQHRSSHETAHMQATHPYGGLLAAPLYIFSPSSSGCFGAANGPFFMPAMTPTAIQHTTKTPPPNILATCINGLLPAFVSSSQACTSHATAHAVHIECKGAHSSVWSQLLNSRSLSVSVVDGPPASMTLSPIGPLS